MAVENIMVYGLQGYENPFPYECMGVYEYVGQYNEHNYYHKRNSKQPDFWWVWYGQDPDLFWGWIISRYLGDDDYEVWCTEAGDVNMYTNRYENVFNGAAGVGWVMPWPVDKMITID
jgi:hypothetical protein